MARASSRNMSSTLRPLRDAWDGSGRLRRDTGFGGAYTQSEAQEAKELLEDLAAEFALDGEFNPRIDVAVRKLESALNREPQA